MVLVEPHMVRVLETMGAGHIRVAVVGNVDAGKSTLIATLQSSTLDDGRGLNRAKIMRHKHEKDTGRTSTISQHPVGFDENGAVLVGGEAEIAKLSSRVVSLMDLAGHEKHFKTTVKGLSMGFADYALVLVNSGQLPTHMTMHHLRLCAACGIPPIVIMTKVDAVPSQVYQQTKKKVVEILRSPEFGGKRCYAIKSEKDVDIVRDKLHSLVPLINVSSVSGEGLDLLKKMLFHAPKRRPHEKKMKRQFEFLIEDVFNVKGIGCVISGFVNAGEYRKGEPLFIGPTKDGTYMRATVRSIHVAQTDVDHTYAGHSTCFAISSLSKTQRAALSKRGMVAVKEVPDPPAVRTFKADLVMLRGEPVTVTKGQYHTTAHVLHLKATVRVVDFVHCNDSSSNRSDAAMVLRPGEQARVTFRVTGPPVYVRKGMRIVLRDGHVRAVGMIVEAHR